MDIGSLSAFAAVYESDSMAQAAKRLFITPQGLSKSIGRMEKELGAPLFTRSAQGVAPTRYAEALYPKVSALLSAMEAVRAEAVRPEDYTVLDVSLSDGMVAYLGLDFIDAFERAHPGVELHASECSNTAIEDFLESGETEVGFLIGPVDETRFSTEFFQQVPHVLIASDESYVGCKDFIDYGDLEGQTVFCLGKDYPVECSLRERLAAAGVRPRAIVGVVGADTVLPFVMRGEGVLVSAAYWADLSRKPGLAVVPFRDETFAWNVYIAQKKGAVPSAAARDFIAFARRWQEGLR